ncbi:hypothetical protein H0H87_007529 [Tephrocybe sp. NHM501043]|nr:hypothetical protein H0H87_007529 [Tephrocybe sp. NHM501043]
MLSSSSVAGPSYLQPVLRTNPTYIRANIQVSVGRSKNWGGRRSFATTSTHLDYYKTLGVPRGATKAQIKTHFYQLSKKHHPDVSKDVRSKEVFTRVTEAYTVLSNDRERRLYDRSLLSRSGPNHPPHPRHQASSASNSGYRPRPSSSATHAWEFTRRHPNPSSPYTRPGHSSRRPDEWARAHTHPGPQLHQHPGQGAHYEPPRPPEGRTGYVGMTPREKLSEQAERDLEVQRISSGWRALQIISVLAVSIGVVGGFH